jgi:hypothetical protein
MYFEKAMAFTDDLMLLPLTYAEQLALNRNPHFRFIQDCVKQFIKDQRK